MYQARWEFPSFATLQSQYVPKKRGYGEFLPMHRSTFHDNPKQTVSITSISVYSVKQLQQYLLSLKALGNYAGVHNTNFHPWAAAVIG